MKRAAGFTLLGMLLTLTLSGVLAGVAIPSLFRISARLRVRAAAQELAAGLRLARLYALRHGARVAVKFRTEPNGVLTMTLFRDGDGDGVRNRDIVDGVDPQVGAPRWLSRFGAGVGLGIPDSPTPVAPGTGKPLDRPEDPIRFNNSDLASFTPWGGATPGTIYVTDGHRNVAAVRVTSMSGRVRIMSYDWEHRRWRHL